MNAGLDVARMWLDGDGTLVNTVDRDGNLLPINLVDGHAITHDPLVVLVSIRKKLASVLCFFSFVDCPIVDNSGQF